MNNHTITLRRRRVRAKIHGTALRPRLSVHISNRQVLAQLVDDDSATTLGYVSSLTHKAGKTTLTQKAEWVGAEIAKVAQHQKITTVIFDRGERKYHGRVQALAEAARTNGLKF